MILRIRYIFFVFTVIMLLSSCATILNGYHQDVKVYTPVPAIVVYKKDSIKTKDNRVVISLERNSNIKEIQVYADSLKRTVQIKPFKSFNYWLNIPYTYGVGLLVDKNTDKKYGHPSYIYVDLKDTLKSDYATYHNFDDNFRKGVVKLHISLPWVNSFHLSPSGEAYKSNTGFWGANLGLDYYHKNRQYIALNAAVVTDFFIPFPAAVDYAGEQEFMSSMTISLSNNHNISRFSLGYGLVLAKHTWRLDYYDRWEAPPPSRPPLAKHHYALGFTFPLYVQLAKSFNVGIIYRPSFFRFNLAEQFKYEHAISLDFAWKIKL